MKLFLYLALLSLITHGAVCAKPVLIANAAVSINSLSSQQVDAIFKGKTPSWPGGQHIELGLLREGYGSTNEKFLNDHIGMSPDQFANYWNRLIFTGRASTPKTFNQEADLINFIASTPNSLGYADDKKLPPSVKVITLQ